MTARAASAQRARRLYGSPGLPVTEACATVALRGLFKSTSRMPRQLLYEPGAGAARRIMRAA